MKYYVINTSADGKLIGFYPQVTDPIFKSQMFSPNSISCLPYANKPTELTEVPKGVLYKKAKLTDLLSTGFLSGKLFISDKLKNILAGSKHEGVAFLNTSLFINGEEDTNYWITHAFLSDYSFLDVANSEFGYENILAHKIERTIQLNTVNDFLAAYKKDKEDVAAIPFPNYWPMVITKLAIKENSELDLFSVTSIRHKSIALLASESLRKKIEDAGCTGIVFTEPNERYP